MLDVDNVVDEVAALIETEAGAEDVAVTISHAADLPRIRGDAIQLQKVILNLVSNSMEAMRDGQGEERELRIATAAQAGHGVRIAVTDTGPGIPEALQERIFEPFVTTKDEHVGLGLPTSRAIVNAHGGSLGYERGPSGETSLVITLPACEENPGQ